MKSQLLISLILFSAFSLQAQSWRPEFETISKHETALLAFNSKFNGAFIASANANNFNLESSLSYFVPEILSENLLNIAMEFNLLNSARYSMQTPTDTQQSMKVLRTLSSSYVSRIDKMVQQLGLCRVGAAPSMASSIDALVAEANSLKFDIERISND